MDKLELATGRLERNVEEAGETLIQVSLQYPLINMEDCPFRSALNRCFSQSAENIAGALSQDMLGEARAAAALLPEALPYQISGSFTPTYNAPGVLSFFTDVFLYTGGMRGITYRYGSSLLTGDGGRPLFLTTFFPPGSDSCALVCDFIAERRGLDRTSVRDAFSSENIYLTENGLAVFFHPGTLGPVAGGIAVFVMPYSEIGPFSPPVLRDMPASPAGK